MRRQEKQTDGGYTLVEVLVAMAIGSTVLGVATTATIGMLHSGADSRTRIANLDAVRVGVDAMSKALRTAIRPELLNPSCVNACSSAFVSASPTDVVFYANLGDTLSGAAAPSRVEYTVAKDLTDPTGTTATITETRQGALSTSAAADGGYLWSAGNTRTFSTGINWTLAANGVFSYANSAAQPLSITGPTTAPAVLGRISTVDIALPVGDASRPSPGVTTSVFLPNSSVGN